MSFPACTKRAGNLRVNDLRPLPLPQLPTVCSVNGFSAKIWKRLVGGVSRRSAMSLGAFRPTGSGLTAATSKRRADLH